jgi:hypothetical protein
MATQLSEQLKYSQAKGADKVVLGPAAPEADRLVAHQHVELGDETREPVSNGLVPGQAAGTDPTCRMQNLQEVQLVLKLVQPVMSTRAGSGIG